MATLTKKVAFNTSIQIISKIITTIIGILTIGLITRYLGVIGFGEYTTIFAFLGFFSILADMGLFSIIVREIARQPEEGEKIIGNIFTIRILAAFLLLGCACLAGFLIPKYSPNIKIGIAIGAIASFFTLLNQALVGIFQVNLRMDRTAIADVIGRFAILSGTIFVINKNLGFLPIVFANAGGNLILFLISFFMASRFIKIRLHFEFDFWKWALKETLPLALIVILGLVYFKVDSILLSFFKGSWEMGIYGAPYKILEILITLPAIFMGSVFPILSRYIATSDPRIGATFQKSFDFISLMAWPIVSGTFVLAGPIIHLIAGPGFDASIVVMQILIFAVGIIFFGTLMGNTIIAANIQKRLVKAYLISVVFNLIANLIFIPIFSYFAAAIITICTELLVCLFAYSMIKKHLGLIPDLKVFSKAALAAIIMGGVLYFIKINLIASIVLGSLIYFLVLILTKAITKEMFQRVLGYGAESKQI